MLLHPVDDWLVVQQISVSRRKVAAILSKEEARSVRGFDVAMEALMKQRSVSLGLQYKRGSKVSSVRVRCGILTRNRG